MGPVVWIARLPTAASYTTLKNSMPTVALARGTQQEIEMTVLIVTGMEGADNCAIALKGILGIDCEVANGRKTALSALRRTAYAAVVVDESIVDSDPAGADLIWAATGLAIPLQVNFALSGAQRLAREIRLALGRRDRELALAHEAAAAALETELKSTVAGLLLQSQLALAEREIPPHIAEKLRIVAELAGSLRQQLSPLPHQPRL
jgi:hypothetical protein